MSNDAQKIPDISSVPSKDLRSKKIWLFDLDGTIFNVKEASRAAIASTLDKLLSFPHYNSNHFAPTLSELHHQYREVVDFLRVTGREEQIPEQDLIMNQLTMLLKQTGYASYMPLFHELLNTLLRHYQKHMVQNDVLRFGALGLLELLFTARYRNVQIGFVNQCQSEQQRSFVKSQNWNVIDVTDGESTEHKRMTLSKLLASPSACQRLARLYHASFEDIVVVSSDWDRDIAAMAAKTTSSVGFVIWIQGSVPEPNTKLGHKGVVKCDSLQALNNHLPFR